MDLLNATSGLDLITIVSFLNEYKRPLTLARDVILNYDSIYEDVMRLLEISDFYAGHPEVKQLKFGVLNDNGDATGISFDILYENKIREFQYKFKYDHGLACNLHNLTRGLMETHERWLAEDKAKLMVSAADAQATLRELLSTQMKAALEAQTARAAMYKRGKKTRESERH